MDEADIDERVDHSNRIGLVDPVVQTFRKQRRLSAIRPLNKAYVVYLDRIALVGTTIGMLFAAAEMASGFGALFAGRAMRLGNPQRTMLSGTLLSILLIAATPLLAGLFGLLLLFQVARGWLEGVIQSVILSV